MATVTPDYALYLLMRKDMDSLNHAGKMVAQGAHAANHAAASIGQGKFGPVAMAAFAEWEKSTPQGFGTTLVVSSIVDRYGCRRALQLTDITMIVENAVSYGVPAGVTNDPTYPLFDGGTTHAFSCSTCGWVFGARKDIAPFVGNLTLQPADPKAH